MFILARPNYWTPITNPYAREETADTFLYDAEKHARTRPARQNGRRHLYETLGNVPAPIPRRVPDGGRIGAHTVMVVTTTNGAFFSSAQPFRRRYRRA